ncbi:MULTISPECIES: nuclear transport factor 2 family protein [unclassified Corynebacterium]|uniref:nuclear transport factor 2 family protein n=1 Tax=unclassified Corynebacterium TaxID=2624378 RepID=UPI0030A4A39A
MTNNFSAYDPAQLPVSVLGYLDAHDDNRYGDARALFTADARVIDDGHIYEGIDEIGTWIERTSGEYDYVSTRTGQRHDDDTHVTVQVRLDGNFPGGTVTLRYQFTLDKNLIGGLVIEV